MFPIIRQKYIDTGKVYYVFKDFPILQLHPQADRASQAAECAGDQDRYWDMHDQLFADQSEWDTTADQAKASFQRYAEVIGLNIDQFNQCYSEGRYVDEVQGDFDEARQLGLSSTPNFVINGKLLVGAHPAEVFTRVIEAELRTLGAE